MPEIEIVLLEPIYEGNIGFAARVMKNFGFLNLTLINPPPIGDEAIARSSHARDVLDNARYAESLDEIIEKSNMLIATTGGLSKSVSNSMRMPYYSPDEVRDIISDIKGRVYKSGFEILVYAYCRNFHLLKNSLIMNQFCFKD